MIVPKSYLKRNLLCILKKIHLPFKVKWLVIFLKYLEGISKSFRKYFMHVKIDCQLFISERGFPVVLESLYDGSG